MAFFDLAADLAAVLALVALAPPLLLVPVQTHVEHLGRSRCLQSLFLPCLAVASVFLRVVVAVSCFASCAPRIVYRLRHVQQICSFAQSSVGVYRESQPNLPSSFHLFPSRHCR